MDLAQRHTRQIVIDRGWRVGTTLENKVSLILTRHGWRPTEVHQQAQVGRYRVDFAWPTLRVALEADGWHHQSPEGAAKDARRDSDLRSRGWLVFRVDDRGGEAAMETQLGWLSRLIRMMLADRAWTEDRRTDSID